MDRQTRNKLKQINQEFYRAQADSFSQTRQQSWSGWRQLTNYLQNFSTPVTILDLGGGNGRFALFLNHTGISYDYLNLEQSFQLLQNQPSQLKAVVTDLEALPLKNHFMVDFMCLFGVIHHIPGYHSRLNLLFKLQDHLKPGGYLAVSFWNLGEHPLRLKKLAQSNWDKYNISTSELEANDYLLNWKNQATRYVHLANKTEQLRLISESGWQIKQSWLADGKSGQMNRYYLLSKN